MRVAFVGGGNMAAAIIGGLAARGYSAADILVAEVDAAARVRLAQRFGVATAPAPDARFAAMDAVVLAVKPQQMRAAAAALAPHLGARLAISIAAGIRLADLSRWLGGHERLVRAMPNTPALVHSGVTGLFAGAAAGAEDRATAEALLGAVGPVIWFDREADLDAVTAVSGSGPAYVFYMIEALEAAARELGIAPDKARALAVQTFAGASRLALERGEDPAKLRADVTSKGGTTERALSVMDTAEIRARFVEAVKAACERSRELGEAMGRDDP
jgi:pyrroline-5-carboxylate reductase